MKVARHKKTRFWAVTDERDTLICICVYRKGAANVARLLRRLPSADLRPPPSGSVRCRAGTGCLPGPKALF